MREQIEKLVEMAKGMGLAKLDLGSAARDEGNRVIVETLRAMGGSHDSQFHAPYNGAAPIVLEYTYAKVNGVLVHCQYGRPMTQDDLTNADIGLRAVVSETSAARCDRVRTEVAS